MDERDSAPTAAGKTSSPHALRRYRSCVSGCCVVVMPQKAAKEALTAHAAELRRRIGRQLLRRIGFRFGKRPVAELLLWPTSAEEPGEFPTDAVKGAQAEANEVVQARASGRAAPASPWRIPCAIAALAPRPQHPRGTSGTRRSDRRNRSTWWCAFEVSPRGSQAVQGRSASRT